MFDRSLEPVGGSGNISSPASQSDSTTCGSPPSSSTATASAGTAGSQPSQQHDTTGSGANVSPAAATAASAHLANGLSHSTSQAQLTVRLQ